MPLTVLGDDDVRRLLHSLNRDDIINLQQTLGDALHYYSSGEAEADNECGASHQPNRTQMIRKDGSTTLFMPGCSNDGMGIKVVTLVEASNSPSLNTVESVGSSVSSLSLSGPSSGTSQTGSLDIPLFPYNSPSESQSQTSSN